MVSVTFFTANLFLFIEIEENNAKSIYCKYKKAVYRKNKTFSIFEMF
jgi:hypothetical protein